MNGAGFGSSYPETFQQQHRMRSMSWCEGGELKSPSSLKADNIHIKQEEIMSASAALMRADSAELQSCSTEVINLKKPSARKNAWGCLSYADLIAKAIESSPNQRLTLNQIYSWMVENVPYFRAKGQTNSSAGWKNSIRHNLSLHGRFVRVQNEGAGKSSWWMVNNNNRMQKTPRRRSTTMDSKSFEKKKKAVTLAKDSFSLKSSPLSASVPAYLGSCGQYQHQIYHQFPHQQPQTQPLDSFETAFRPVDRQHCGFQEKEHAFSIKSAGMLRYGDNCYTSNDMRGEIFEANALGNSRGSIGSPNDGQILFCSLQPITSITKQADACQQFGQATYNMGAQLISQPACSALPDFFKLPDDAWRQYLPPSPNGLTETVISSESLTALLETGAESEIIDLVPPSLSTFDEEGNERKKETKDRCKFAQNDSSEKLLEAGDKCQSGARRESGSCLVDQSSHLNAPLSPSFINQDKESTSTSVLRHVLTTVTEEDPENAEHLSDFPISSSVEQTFISFVGEVQGLASKDHQTPSGEFEDAFEEDKNESFTLPYKMPLNADDGQTPAVIPAVPSFVLTGDVAMTSDATSQDERADGFVSSESERDALLAPALFHAAAFSRF